MRKQASPGHRPGSYRSEEMSPEGAQPLCRPFRACPLSAGEPRALPWAGLFSGLWPSRLLVADLLSGLALPAAALPESMRPFGDLPHLGHTNVYARKLLEMSPLAGDGGIPGQPSAGPGEKFSGSGKSFSGCGERVSGCGKSFPRPARFLPGPAKSGPGPATCAPGPAKCSPSAEKVFRVRRGLVRVRPKAGRVRRNPGRTRRRAGRGRTGLIPSWRINRTRWIRGYGTRSHLGIPAKNPVILSLRRTSIYLCALRRVRGEAALRFTKGTRR